MPSRILIAFLLFILFSMEYIELLLMENYSLSLILFINILSVRLPQKCGGLVALIRICDCNCVYLHSFGEFIEFIYMFIYTNDAAIGIRKSQWHKMRNAQVENFVNVYQAQGNVNSIWNS